MKEDLRGCLAWHVCEPSAKDPILYKHVTPNILLDLSNEGVGKI